MASHWIRWGFATFLTYTTLAYAENYQLDALLQTWVTSDRTTRATPQDNFRIRRAEVGFSGSLNSKIRWFLMGDLTRTVALQDLGIVWRVMPNLEVSAGQFRTLTSAEGLLGNGDLLLPERSYLARAFGDQREPGIKASYYGQKFTLGAMVSNGQGPNTPDVTSKKDLSIAGEVTPISEVTAGGFVLLGDFSYSTKGRFGLFAEYTRHPIYAFGEYIQSKETLVGPVVEGNGFTIMAGWRVTELWEIAGRFETFTPNRTVPTKSTAITLGVNHFLVRGRAKIQAALGFLTNMSGSGGSYVPAANTNGNLFTLAFQVNL